jgi:NAD+ synthase
VTGIIKRVEHSQYKRRLPIIAKLSQRTVGIDFRYPRDWGG